ncbi:MAG: ATP-grasp domain-containing protein [Syntrophothermus sp.]
MTRILIGEISSYKAIVICHFLKRVYPGVTILSYDYHSGTKIFRTRYSDQHVVIPFVNNLQYADDLSRLVKDHHIDVFLPVHSDYIQEILEQKEKFGNSLSYLGDFGQYLQLHNKNNLYRLATSLNISVPVQYTSLDDAVIPFVCKPDNKSSAKGVFYVHDEQDRISVKSRNPDLTNYLFQEYITGKGCGYSVYAENGIIRIAHGHLRLAEYPVTGGSSVYRQNYFHRDMADTAKKILEKVPWTGFAMFEFKLTPDGRLVLIEVNPRIWGSINQGLKNNINFFEQIIAGKKKAIHPKNYNTYLSPQVLLSFLGYLKKGNLHPLMDFCRNFLRNRKDIGLFTDPLGWLSVIIRYFGKN